MNEAHYDYECLLETDTERDSSYKWFDIRDREFKEERVKICEALQQLERETLTHRSSVTASGKSHRSQRSKTLSHATSFHSLPQARADATVRARKMRVEMDFLERDKEAKCIQFEKQLALAKEEERTYAEMLDMQEIKPEIKPVIMKPDIEPKWEIEKLKSEQPSPGFAVLKNNLALH